MVTVDGVKYISEGEFNKAVHEELHEISRIAANHIVAGEVDMLSAMFKAGAIAESYSNLHDRVFLEKENLDLHE